MNDQRTRESREHDRYLVQQLRSLADDIEQQKVVPTEVELVNECDVITATKMEESNDYLHRRYSGAQRLVLKVEPLNKE